MATYKFATPFVVEPFISDDPVAGRYRHMNNGVTVYKLGGVYHADRFVVQDVQDACTEFYQGGYTYTKVTQAQRDGIIAANIGVSSSNFTVE